MSEEEKALYIVMRADLKMPRGKEIAQAIHAFYELGSEGFNDMDRKTAVICVRTDSEEAFNAIVVEAVSTLHPERVAIIKDAARTVLPEPAVTCACIGPVKRGRLPKLSEAQCY